MPRAYISFILALSTVPVVTHTPVSPPPPSSRGIHTPLTSKLWTTDDTLMVEFQAAAYRRPQGEICLELGATTVSPEGLLTSSQVEACRGLPWGHKIKSVRHYVPWKGAPLPSLDTALLTSVRWSTERSGVGKIVNPGNSGGNWPQGRRWLCQPAQGTEKLFN